MDNKFTEEIGSWLTTPEKERDYKVSALWLLKLSGNQIMYLNKIRSLDNRRGFIEYNIQKH